MLDTYPQRKAVGERVKDLLTSTSNDYYDLLYRGGKLFAMKRQPPLQQPLLVTLTLGEDTLTEQIVVDPNTLEKGGTTAIDFFQPSLDGRHVAVSLSEKGSEDGTLNIFETSGKRLPERIARVNFPTAGGSVAWNADGTGGYYTRYPAA